MNAVRFNLGLLAAIATVTADAGHGMFTDNAELAELSNAGYVATNPNMKDGDNVAAMITDSGKAYLAEQSAASTSNSGGDNSAPKTEKQTFVVSSIKRPEPVKRTRDGGGSKYPFDELELPDADGNVRGFFVPATEDMPDPVKSLTSAISQANRSYGSIVGKKTRADGKEVNQYQFTRRFRLTAHEQDGVKGAYVYRDVDDKAGDTDEGDDGDTDNS